MQTAQQFPLALSIGQARSDILRDMGPLDASFWAGAVIGAGLGLIFSVLFQHPLEGLKSRAASTLRRKLPGGGGTTEDYRHIEMYQLLRWSRSRPLDPNRHHAEADHSPRQEQTWFAAENLATEIAKWRARTSGTISEIASLTVDHGESGEASKGVVINVRPSEYPDAQAAVNLLLKDENWHPVKALIEEQGIQSALRTAPDFRSLCS